MDTKYQMSTMCMGGRYRDIGHQTNNYNKRVI